MSDFDTDAERQRRLIERDSRKDPGQLGAYITPDGQPSLLTGDDDAPWSEPLGRASADGSTGLVLVSDGRNNRLAVDGFGHLWTRPVAVAALGASVYTSSAEEASAVVKASAGVVYECHALVSAAVVDLWLMIFNRTTVPGAGAVPIWRALLPNPGGGPGEVWVNFPLEPLPCTTGIAVGLSTTAITYTAAANICLWHVEYR